MKYSFIILLFLFSCVEKTASNNTVKGDSLYNQGISFLEKDDLKAYSKLQQAITYYSKQKDSSNISKSLICQAIAQRNRGDVLGSESTLVEALRLMDEHDESLFSVYNTLANLNFDQKRYSDAIKWYNKALAENIDSKNTINNILNNIAIAKSKIGQHSQAIKILDSININEIKDKPILNRIRDNREYVKWLKNNNYPAEENIEKILNDKLQDKDFWGANSSYSHLAEINKEKNSSLSLVYAKEMLSVATRIKSPEDRLEAIERIALTDNPLNSKIYFAQYKALSDSIQSSKNNYSEKFAFIKYDSERKNSENLKLRANKVQNQNNILILFIALILSLIVIFWYRRRQLRLVKENELKIKNNQLQVSKKVHDVVANGIYQVMTKIENQDNFNKEQALDELEFVYEKSRDISYEKPDSLNQNFKEKISNLIASFKNEEVNTFIAGNDEQLWENVLESTQTEIYQVIRELLVNMKKHSKASNVAFRFEKKNNSINIHYTDNGIGISDELIFKNGLSNTVSRIDNINGKITFDTKTEKGLKINISFPVS